MQNSKKEIGFTPKQQLPQIDGAKIWFIEKTNNYMRYEGLWVEAEQMFFIGFEQKGYFRFKHEITKWGYLNNEDNGREQGLEKP
jgi:hypothetical protein